MSNYLFTDNDLTIPDGADFITVFRQALQVVQDFGYRHGLESTFYARNYLCGYIQLYGFNLKEPRDIERLNRHVENMGDTVQMKMKLSSTKSRTGATLFDVLLYRSESPVWQLYAQDNHSLLEYK